MQRCSSQKVRRSQKWVLPMMFLVWLFHRGRLELKSLADICQSALLVSKSKLSVVRVVLGSL